jgi:hypothetical protein
MLQECFISATMNAFYLNDTGDYYTSKVVKLKETEHSELFIYGYEYRLLIANSDSGNAPHFKSTGKQIKDVIPDKDTTITLHIENSSCTSLVILVKRI